MTEHNNHDGKRKSFHIPSWAIPLTAIVAVVILIVVVSILTAPEPTIMAPGPQPSIDTIA